MKISSNIAALMNTETSLGIDMNDVGFGYVTGDFFGTATFGLATLTSQGSGDAFIARLQDLITSGQYGRHSAPPSFSQPSKALENEMLLYPSPAYDLLNIVVKLKDAEHAKIELFDIYGNKINEIANTTFDERVFTINVSHLAKGTYIVRLSSNKFTTSQKFLIIN